MEASKDSLGSEGQRVAATFPRERVEGNPGPRQPKRMRCLIVDDELGLRRVLLRAMSADGFDCSEAADGVEALRMLEREPVALVLSDLRMPHMDGVELLRHVHARYPDTAVVLVSAIADVNVAVGCLGNGAMDFLSKPFLIEEVRARVAQALDKHRLVLENRQYRTHLEARVAEQARHLEQNSLAVIQGFAEALELKDAYTSGHSVRVGEYSAAMARQLGLPAEVVRQVELAGQVHDVGKIGVRESVLNKRGPLTTDEYRHVMIHPVLGWHMLAPLLADLPLVLNVVRSHHERFDGCGVPDGLAGEAIALEARIAAVADAFDAMTSSRPYRPMDRLPLEVAVAELERGRGSQFDSRMVDAFLAAMANGTITLPPNHPPIDPFPALEQL